MGRNPQPARALCAIIFAHYPHLFDDPVWQAQYEFYGFDTNNIRFVNNADLVEIREFLKHLKNLTLDKAIDAVNAGDSFVDGRNAYFHWWSKSGLLRKLKVVHEKAIRASGINVKMMYRVHATKGTNKFLTVGHFRHKDAELAEALFGSAHEHEASGAMHMEFQELLTSLTNDYIERHRKARNTAKKNKDAAKRQLDAVWKAVASGIDVITKQSASKITKALVKYEKSIGWDATEEEKKEVEEFERRKGEWEQVLTKTKANEEELKKQRKTSQYILGRTVPSRMNVVATEEEITALRQEFVDEMKAVAARQEEEEIHEHDGDVNPGPRLARPGLVELDQWEKCGDMGVEAWSKTTEEELKKLLRWPEGRPVEFNAFINSTLQDFWDKPDYVKNIPPEGDLDNTPTHLMWHQLVGVMSMVNMFWTEKEEPNGVPGAILADEVGLGKSAQVMALLAFIMAARRSQNLGLAPPPVIGKLPYFCGRKEVLNAPHLLLVPTTLLGQWRSELKRWFRPHVVDIFILPSMQRGWEDFYKRLDASKQDPCNIIIIGTHSTISQMGHRNLRLRKGKKMTASEIPAEKGNELGYAPLWHRQFCTATVDEAHSYRTTNAAYYALRRLLLSAWVKLLATATPLFQSPRDLNNLGRLIQIQAFLGAKAEAAEADVIREIARLRRKVLKDKKEALIDYNSRALVGENTDNPLAAVYARNEKWVLEIQAQFAGRVIRRSGNSTVYTDPPKKPVKTLMNDLPPYELIEVSVALTNAEKEEMEAQVNKWTKSAKKNGAVDVTDGGAFLLNYRLALAYPETLRHKDEDEGHEKTPKYAPFKTLAEWDAHRGAKLQSAVEICLHMLSDDDRPPPIINPDTNEMHFPDLPPLPEGGVRKSTRKILIFHEFPMMDEMVKSVFALFGIRMEAVNGKMKQEARDKIIQEFVHGEDIRVLLLSQVGTSGLNLMRATVVMILTIGWSGVEQSQMIGRAHRNGQSVVVYVFRIIARNTIDVLMANNAGAKAMQLEQFFSKKESNNLLNRKAYELLYNCAAPGEDIPDLMPTGDDDEDDDEEDDEDNDSATPVETTKTTARKTTAKTKGMGTDKEAAVAKKRKAADVVDMTGEEEGAETPAAKKQRVTCVRGKKTEDSRGGEETGMYQEGSNEGAAKDRKRKKTKSGKSAREGAVETDDAPAAGMEKSMSKKKNVKGKGKSKAISSAEVENESEEKEADAATKTKKTTHEGHPPGKKLRFTSPKTPSSGEIVPDSQENAPAENMAESSARRATGLVRAMKPRRQHGTSRNSQTPVQNAPLPRLAPMTACPASSPAQASGTPVPTPAVSKPESANSLLSQMAVRLTGGGPSGSPSPIIAAKGSNFTPSSISSMSSLLDIRDEISNFGTQGSEPTDASLLFGSDDQIEQYSTPMSSSQAAPSEAGPNLESKRLGLDGKLIFKRSTDGAAGSTRHKHSVEQHGRRYAANGNPQTMTYKVDQNGYQHLDLGSVVRTDLKGYGRRNHK